ncbi:hypothetical protein OQX61_14480 [Pedobacter sp. PLR]|uniref:hypothetical protein n=1 Tax=Pedobacter sp. PLR TaxID=2994465 RepID=UPI002245BEAC|nr:hypothetical protein [Pedobacter sp. PLR]MCX2452479.1 hypothetical protein [Pedobacter sp. PLR]
MNSIKITSLALLIMLQFVACKQSGRIQVIDLDENVKTAGIAKNLTKGTNNIDFCKLINVDWDLIWIITPYAAPAQIDKIKAENFSAIKSWVLTVSAGDQYVQLIVLKQNKVVAYGKLSRLPLDLGNLRRPDGSLASISKENCGHFMSSDKIGRPGYSLEIDSAKL